MPDVTPFRNYPRNRADGKEPGVTVADIIHDALTAIDADVQSVVDDQDAINTTTDSTITTLQADLDALNDTVVEIFNTRKDLETLPTSTTITYNGNNEMTLYEDSKYKFFSPTYSSGKLTQFDETIKLKGVTYRVTLNYTGDNLTSITRVTV